MSRPRAVEIDGDDAAWLRGQPLPGGVELVELDEVELWGRTYDRAPGSGLYLPAGADATERAIERYMAEAEEPAPPVGIDLFSGCGGFSLGVHEAGIDVVAAAEWDTCAAHTYLTNLGHPDCQIIPASEKDRTRWETYTRKSKDMAGPWMGSAYRDSSRMEGGCRAFFFGDICKLTGEQIMEGAGVEDVDVIFGGPPCQGLSTSNSKACLEDPRNGMLWEFMRLVTEILPRTFMIENVPALLTVGKGALFNALAAIANEHGYNVVAQKVNACDYGVPQHRVRALVIGTQEESPEFRFPMPTHWALGRPVKGKGWAVGGGPMGDTDELDKKLPRQAHFDLATRRWSVPGPATEPTVAPPAAEPSLFDQGSP